MQPRLPIGDGLVGRYIPVDFSANAASLGARCRVAKTLEDLTQAIEQAKKESTTSVIVVETNYHDRVPGYESWWDVPIAEVSQEESVRQAYLRHKKARENERYFWPAR